MRPERKRGGLCVLHESGETAIHAASPGQAGQWLVWKSGGERPALERLSVRERKLDIDVLAEVIHLKALLVVGHDRAHDVFIAVLFFA